MAENSSIEWTDTTWNPVTGCTKISAGCNNCYAARLSERFRGVPGHPFETGFDLTLRPERLLQPLAWKRPRMIFVNSMSDKTFRAHISRPFSTRWKRPIGMSTRCSPSAVLCYRDSSTIEAIASLRPTRMRQRCSPVFMSMATMLPNGGLSSGNPRGPCKN